MALLGFFTKKRGQILSKRDAVGRPGGVGLYHKKRHTCEEPNVPDQISPETVWSPSGVPNLEIDKMAKLTKSLLILNQNWWRRRESNPRQMSFYSKVSLCKTLSMGCHFYEKRKEMRYVAIPPNPENKNYVVEVEWGELRLWFSRLNRPALEECFTRAENG